MTGRNRKSQGPAITLYPDNGCVLWPRCLTCPFPSCRHDINTTGISTPILNHYYRIIAFYNAHPLPPASVARRLRTTERKVNRALEWGQRHQLTLWRSTNARQSMESS